MRPCFSSLPVLVYVFNVLILATFSVTPEESLEEDRSAEAVREDESIVSCPDIAADPLPSQENIEIHGER